MQLLDGCAPGRMGDNPMERRVVGRLRPVGLKADARF
jgi:hypothetical protein